jgi:hypothetical protein
MPKQLFELARLLPSHASNNQVPVYSSTTKSWGAGNVDLSVIDGGGGNEGDALILTGGVWTPTALDTDVQLSDIDATGHTNGDVAQLVGGTWSSTALNDLFNIGTFTPTLITDGGGADPNLGSTGTIVGRYIQIGKLAVIFYNFTFSGSGVAAGSGIYVVGAIPVTISSSTAFGVARAFDSSASLFYGADVLSFTASSLTMERRQTGASGDQFVANNIPMTWAASDACFGILVAEVA